MQEVKSNQALQILLVEDQESDAKLVELALKDIGRHYELRRVDTREELLEALDTPLDLIISDYELPELDGFEVLNLYTEKKLTIPFIFVSGHLDEEVAVKFMKAGAHDFVHKDKLFKLAPTVQRELKDAKTRQTLKIIHSQYQQVVELSLDAIFVLYHDEIRFANQAAYKMLGAKNNQSFVGECFSQFVAPKSLKALRQYMKEAFNQKNIGKPYECAMLRCDNTNCAVEIRAIPYTDQAGMLQIVVRDHSELTEAEQQITHQEQKINKYVKENEKLMYTDFVRSEYLSTMSHELRTPLNAIIGFSELLASGVSGPLNEKQKEFCNSIFKSGKHLLSIINDILDMSQIEAGRMILCEEKFDISSFLEDALSIFQLASKEKNLQLSVNVAPNVSVTMFDRRRLKQIIYNLIANAIKFTPAGGVINVTVAQSSEGSVQMVFSDTGEGINAAEMHNLFKPYVQVSLDKRLRSEGTGLGLVIVKKLVDLHNGDIQVQSEKGKGTRFILNFPNRLVA